MRTATSSWGGRTATTCSASLQEETSRAAADGAPCVAEIFSASLARFPFAAPKGIAVAADGTVYVASTGGSQGPTGVNDDVVGIFPDGTIAELASRASLGIDDWNPAGIAIDEKSGDGVFVYATGPTGSGGTVRIGPDGTADRIFTLGGQGLVVDDAGTAYVAVPIQPSTDPSNGVYQIPDARHGVCGVAGKECPRLISDGDIGCDGNPISVKGPYALALAGGILYVSMQGTGGNNVVRLALRTDNVLGLPLCPEEIFPDGDANLTLTTPRALAADGARERLCRRRRQRERHLDQAGSDGQDQGNPTRDHQPNGRDRSASRDRGGLAGQRLRLRKHHEQRLSAPNHHCRPHLRRRSGGEE